MYIRVVLLGEGGLSSSGGGQLSDSSQLYLAASEHNTASSSQVPQPTPKGQTGDNPSHS